MDTKKIIIGLVGGAVAGYVYYEFIANKKVVKTVAEGVEEVVEEGEGEIKSIGGGGGGGGFIPTTETGATTTNENTDILPKPAVVPTPKPAVVPTPKPAVVPTPKPAVQPIKEPIVSVKPLVYTKPAPTTTYTTSTYTKPMVSVKEPYTKELASISRFSGIGGDKWEANIDNLDI